MPMLEITIVILGCLLAVIGTLLLIIFKDMKNDVKAMSKSMAGMNTKLEKVITDQTWHKEEISDVKHRVQKLEEDRG